MPPVRSEGWPENATDYQPVDAVGNPLPPPLHPLIRMAPAPLCNIYARYARIYMEAYTHCFQLLNMIETGQMDAKGAKDVIRMRLEIAKKKATRPARDNIHLNRLKNRKSIGND